MILAVLVIVREEILFLDLRFQNHWIKFLAIPVFVLE